MEPWLARETGMVNHITRTAIGEQVIHAAQKGYLSLCRPTPEDCLVASFAWEIKKHASAYRFGMEVDAYSQSGTRLRIFNR